jgi:hypothetical protein
VTRLPREYLMLKKVKLLGLALVALCALSATVVSMTASALPVVLPESSSERAWTGKNVGTEEQVLETTGGSKISCKAAVAEGTEESKKPLGLFHIHFSKCTTAGGLATCHSLGDESGIILSLGSWHFVFDTLGTTLGQAGVGILFLVQDVHIECATVLILVFAGGMVLCLVTKPTTSATSHEFFCKSNGSPGLPLERSYYNETGTNVQIATLLSSESGKTALQAVEIASGTVSESTALEIML